MPLYPLNELLGQPLDAYPLPPPYGAEAVPDFNSSDYRDVGDVDAMRTAIFDTVQRQAANIEPVANSRYTLSLSDVKYTGPDKITKAQHKKALLKNDYLTRKLWGTWTLSDTATGKPVASRATVVAHVPYLTSLGTFTKGGNDYTLAHQMRLKPGVYTRWQDNGELEAHVNVEGGMGHRIYLEPETGVFKMKFGQANLPAADVLQALGATPEQLKEAWGEKLYNTNINKTDPKALHKLFQKITNGHIKAENPDEKKAAIRDAFARMKLDPSVSEYTLGRPYDTVNVESILATTQKLLAINAGKADTESRDDLTFQKVLGPEDIIAERFSKGKAALRNALWKAAKTGTLDKMPSGIFNKAIDEALISTGLGLPLEEINPLEVFDNQYRITRLGEGGIASLTAVPDSARDVHPSQLGFIDVIRSPESMKVGVDGRLTTSVKKGKDGSIYTQLRDMKGNKVWKSAQDIAESVVAFPNALRSKNHFVPAVAHGKMQLVPRETVDYEVPYMQNAFHSLGNLIPMVSSAKGQRLNMGTRFLSQALPLEHPEAPLVQCGLPDEDDKSYEELFGEKVGAVRAKENGVVISVTPDELVFKNELGEKKTIDLYNNMVFNRKTGMSQTPVVKPGDPIKAGQLLAKSNFTDDNGTTAVGCNARVAYLPYKGYNWEDAAVISESFAKRMSSTHYYKNKLAIDGSTVTGKERFLALKPGKYTNTQLDNFTKDGVIKPGTVVNTGDPLILAANKVEPTEAQLKAGKKGSYHDSSLTWEHHDPGVVTDVYASPKGMQVIVKTVSQMHVADKLANRYGTKCVVGAVVPDEELPSLPDGSKPEVLLSSLAVVGRVNPAQTAEAMLGRVAAKTGKRYAIKDFDDKDYIEFAKEELRKAGLNETEDLIDTTNPDYPKVIPHVAVGNSFIMKLQHTVESKAQSRGIGGYSMDQQPAKGGDDGAKRMGIMEINALLGHGATENINDMRFIKGQQNLDYWRQYMSGYTPPTPKVPYVYDRFVNYLKGAGINVLRDGPRLNIMAMTSKDIDNICGNRELKGVVDKRTGLQTLSTVAWDSNMKTVKGGLFDDEVTGGHGGDKWSYIKLADKLPNPVMEQPLRLMLGYTEKDFRDVLAGKKETAHGTGPQALYEAAKTLDIDTEIAKARLAIDSGRKTYRDAAVKRLGYLKNAKRLKQNPVDWFTDKVPVIPPVFRPVAQLGDNKLPLVADPNYLYKDLFDANQTYQANKKAFGDKESGDLGLYVYDNFKAVTGLSDPAATESKTRKVKGLLKAVFSDAGPKYNMMQRQLLGMPVDFSGRSVIAPDPNLDMDAVGIPENIAWDAYKPFVIRRLRQYGRSGMQAIDEVKNKTKAAKEALQTEMESRPILINRAPTLHKFGFMAFNPKLMAGDHIHVNPFVCGGFGADFDGDAVQFHVPTTKEAMEEAREKMLPSRNLLATGSFKNEADITKENLIGLYETTRKITNDKRPLRTFASKADVIKAYREGKIGPTDRVTVLE